MLPGFDVVETDEGNQVTSVLGFLGRLRPDRYRRDGVERRQE